MHAQYRMLLVPGPQHPTKSIGSGVAHCAALTGPLCPAADTTFEIVWQMLCNDAAHEEQCHTAPANRPILSKAKIARSITRHHVRQPTVVSVTTTVALGSPSRLLLDRVASMPLSALLRDFCKPHLLAGGVRHHRPDHVARSVFLLEQQREWVDAGAYMPVMGSVVIAANFQHHTDIQAQHAHHERCGYLSIPACRGRRCST